MGHQHAERQHAQQQQQQQQQQHANANGSGDAKGPKDVPPFLKPWVDTLQQFAKETLGIDDVNIDVLVDHPFLKAMFQDPATAASPGHDACFRGKQRGGCHPFFFFHPPTQVSQQEEPSSTTKPTTATTTTTTTTTSSGNDSGPGLTAATSRGAEAVPDFGNVLGPFTQQVVQLLKMGFSTDPARLQALLQRHNGSLNAVISELVNPSA